MTYKGYDGISKSKDSYPGDGVVYIAYANGKYVNLAEMESFFPGKVLAQNVKFVKGFRMVDCENEDVTPEQAIALAEASIADGIPFITYANKSTKAELVAIAEREGKVFPANPAGWAEGVVANYWWAGAPVEPPREVLVPEALGTQWGWYPGYDVTTWLYNPLEFKTPLKKEPPVSLPDVPDAPPDSETITSANGTVISAPIVGAASVISTTNPGEKGYYLVGADGGVYAFGAAVFEGSIPGLIAEKKLNRLNEPIVGIIAFDQKGYNLIAADGGVFAFGDAPFEGTA